MSRLPLSRLSFRWQITLLGTLVFVLFVAVLFATFATLHYTRSAVLSSEKKQLVETTQNLVREYKDKAEYSRQNSEPAPLEHPDTASSRELLALLSRVVLQNLDGVAGGFYSKSGDALLGYAFAEYGEPFHDGDYSASDRQLVLQTARKAAATNQNAEQEISNGAGILLVEAVPIVDGSSTVGSVWTTKRFVGQPGANRFRAYLITVGLGAAALASVLLTLLVIHNLQGGVRKIEGGLRNLEGNLTSQMEPTSEPEEIRQILLAISRLGATLAANIEREKQIENELRHSERLAGLGRLVAGVAHEVRNPLATIRLRVQMCQRDTNNLRIKESCDIALDEIDRLNGIVNRLLNFARPIQLHLEQADLKQIIERRMEFFRDKAQKSGITLVARLPEWGMRLPVDKDRIAQVFDNIIQNAIEAMSAGGTLSVTVKSEAAASENVAGVCVEFQDTGAGMDASVVDHVFDPFFTTKPSGTGLGLSISHELIRAHGGDIRVDTGEGHGTRVRVTIPMVHA